jgi:hypothetical protein
MNYVLDPGALLAASQLSPDRAYSAMPNAPVIPDALPGTGRVRRVRGGLATTLEALAGKVRPYEPAPVCRSVAPGH